MEQNDVMFNAVHEAAIKSTAIARIFGISHADLMARLYVTRLALPAMLHDTIELRSTPNPDNSYYLLSYGAFCEFAGQHLPKADEVEQVLQALAAEMRPAA